MNMREQFEARFPTPAGVEWDEANQCYKCKVPSPYLALWMGWTAARDTTCPGHGRSECVSCCWPKGEAPEPAGYTAVDMGTAAADGYQDGVDNVEPEWVVNSIAELGVKIGDRFYFLYKGRSLEYESPEDEHEKPLMWRPVFKREFGEVCTPINRYAQGLIGTVSLEDSDEWLPLPARSVSP